MKFISAKVHGCLDYGVVLLFLAAPALLHFTMVPSLIAYTLAGIHLLLTFLTDFPLGAIKVIPLKWHGVVEMVVGPVLMAIPFIFGFASEAAAGCFYEVIGMVILLVWGFTAYVSAKKK
jgi:hypothetical protein